MIKNKIKFARTAIVRGSKAGLFSLGISREANDHVVVVAPVSGGGEAGLSGQAGNRLGSGLGSTPDQNLHNVSVLLRIESRKLWKKMLWFSLKEYSTKEFIYHGILLNYKWYHFFCSEETISSENNHLGMQYILNLLSKAIREITSPQTNKIYIIHKNRPNKLKWFDSIPSSYG